MPVALRRRLYCHYCGKKSNQTNQRKFQCEHCLAVNYLDANGTITDPPAEVTCAPTRYATPQTVPTNKIFCATCLKNQDIVARLVADYVPDEDDPDYSTAIAGLPAYRERLEQNYPQCCSACEPRARAQLQYATTAAKSDNMLRNLQKTRLKRARASLDWRPLVLRAAALGYAFSVIVQLVWHLLGAQGGERPLYRNPVQCLVTWPAPSKCFRETSSILPLAVAVGFICVWWNPQLTRKLKSQDGRLVGLGRYYAIQGLILAFRMFSWIMLSDFVVEKRLTTMIHAVSLILLTILTGAGLFTVDFDTAPRIDWNYEPPRLVSDTQFIPPPVQEEPSFPIHDLAGPAQESLQPWRPPVLAADDEDEMDWQPSYNLQPRQPKPKFTAPSPFYGKLPTLSGGLHKQEPKQSIGLPPGFFDRRDPLPKRKAPATGLAEPKFFPQSIDTGLENMFDQVFSLGDEARPKRTFTLRKPQHRRLSRPAQSSQSSGGVDFTPDEASALPLFSAVILLLLLGLWMISGHLLIAVPDLRLYVLGCGALPTALRVFKPAALPSILFLTETVGLVTFAAMVNSFDSDAYIKIGAASLAFLIIQELFIFSQQESPGATEAEVDSQRAAETEMPTPPLPASAFQFPPATTSNSGLHHRASAESMFSDHSTSTTSTAPDWKTPKATRVYKGRRESNFGISGLRL